MTLTSVSPPVNTHTNASNDAALAHHAEMTLDLEGRLAEKDRIIAAQTIRIRQLEHDLQHAKRKDDIARRHRTG